MTAAVRVLETLIITHGNALRDHIKALPPLPQSLPALVRVNEVIAQQRGRLKYNEQIQLLLPALGHHSQSVRAMALQVRFAGDALSWSASSSLRGRGMLGRTESFSQEWRCLYPRCSEKRNASGVWLAALPAGSEGEAGDVVSDIKVPGLEDQLLSFIVCLVSV